MFSHTRISQNKKHAAMQCEISPNSILIHPASATAAFSFAPVFDPFLDQIDYMFAVEGEPYITAEQVVLYKDLDLTNPVHITYAALCASRCNHALVLRQLFRFGLRSDYKDSKNRPLFFRLRATEPFFQDCCLLFEAHGADLSYVCANGTSLLHYCFSAPSSSELVHYLTGKWYTSFIKSNVEFLMKRGLSWDYNDIAGRTPLTLAACEVAIESALCLGASPNLAFSQAMSIKHLFAKSPKSLAMLFAHGLDPLEISINGYALLSLAISHEALAFIEAALTFRPAWASVPCVPSGWIPAAEAAASNSSCVLELLFRLDVCGPFDAVTISSSESDIPLALLCARNLRLQTLDTCVSELQDDDQLIAVFHELQHQITQRAKDLTPDFCFHAQETLNKLQKRRELIRALFVSQSAPA
jgi:hypothetical protein